MVDAHDIVRRAGGEELYERLLQLDARQTPTPPASPSLAPPEKGTRIDYDVVLVGGGLSLLYAPLLAMRGLSVAVCERHRAGTAHREWNASYRELEALTHAGLCTREELDALVVARYDGGVCRWFGGGSYEVRGVLDVAVDAGHLLTHARRRAEALGVTFFDGATLVHEAWTDEAVRLRFVRNDGRSEDLVARLWLDARGAQSDVTGADLVCPTVGGVVRGLAEGDAADEMNPKVGEILATTEDVEDGRQHIWEAFPGRPGETTVYLFYYAPTGSLGAGALMSLYARFFEKLPIYKRGDATLVRPTFGFIPGWSRLSAPPRSPHPRRVLVGDAAARHSPLTFCGFGATLRSLGTATDAIVRGLDSPTQLGMAVVDDRPIHRGTGALARMVAAPDPRPSHAHELNALLDVAFATLYEMGNEAYAALLRDEMSLADFTRFLTRTSRRRPRVYLDVFARLGAGDVARWLFRSVLPHVARGHYGRSRNEHPLA